MLGAKLHIWVGLRAAFAQPLREVCVRLEALLVPPSGA